MKVKCDHRSKFSNLSNWKEEAWKNQGFNGIRTHDLRDTGAMFSRWSPEFFRLLLSNCLNWKIYCDDHTSVCILFLLNRQVLFIQFTLWNNRFPYPFLYLNLWSPYKRVSWSLPFYIPDAWKKYPFRAEQPRIGHYKVPTPGFERRKENKAHTQFSQLSTEETAPLRASYSRTDKLFKCIWPEK